jgi:hypothetical protein
LFIRIRIKSVFACEETELDQGIVGLVEGLSFFCAVCMNGTGSHVRRCSVRAS